MLKPFQLFPPLYRIVFFDFHENPRTRFFKNTIQAGGMPQTLKVGLTTQVCFLKKNIILFDSNPEKKKKTSPFIPTSLE